MKQKQYTGLTWFQKYLVYPLRKHFPKLKWTYRIKYQVHHKNLFYDEVLVNTWCIRLGKIKCHHSKLLIPHPVNNKNTRTRCETCAKLIIKKSKRQLWRSSAIFIATFEHVSSDFEQVNDYQEKAPLISKTETRDLNLAVTLNFLWYIKSWSENINLENAITKITFRLLACCLSREPRHIPCNIFKTEFYITSNQPHKIKSSIGFVHAVEWMIVWSPINLRIRITDRKKLAWIRKQTATNKDLTLKIKLKSS